jgi:hypothetical protein
MLKTNPALESQWPLAPLTLKWVGVYAQILKTTSPPHIRRIAGAMHNRRQHNASASGLSDLTRKYQQMAMANFQAMQQRISLSLTPHRPCPSKCFILTAEQVWDGYFQSAFDPDGAVKAANTPDLIEALVCFLPPPGHRVTM